MGLDITLISLCSLALALALEVRSWPAVTASLSLFFVTVFLIVVTN
jgi:hypothetical protein